MSHNLTDKIPEFEALKSYPKALFYQGDLALLQRPKVTLVGTRRPSTYTREYAYRLAKTLAKYGVCVVSGAAMGVDAIAHQGAGCSNTIAVVANGLDIRYPKVNQALIAQMEKEGLVLSQYADGMKATRWSFVQRNALVVALGEVLVVAEADLESGSMRSVAYAQEMGKEIYVLPHRLGESLGTQKLLHQGEAKLITDVEAFAASFSKDKEVIAGDQDPLVRFCLNSPTLEEGIAQFGERIYEAEIEGLITIEQGIVRVV